MARYRFVVYPFWATMYCFVLAALLVVLHTSIAHAQLQRWPDHTPLIDGDDGSAHNSCNPTSSLYKCQFHGFLYGHWNDNGSNTADTTHINDGIARANAVQPLCPDPLHQPNCQDSQKKIGVVMIGMSNWTKEGCGSQLFGNPPVSIQPPPVNDKNCGLGALPDDRKYSFIYKATSHSQVNNGRLIFADCAEIGAVAGYWINDSQGPQGGPAHLWTNCHDIITALGLTDAQVQVVLFKQADSGESSPPPPNPTLMPLPTGAGTFAGCSGSPQEGQPDACNLQAFMTTIAQQVKVHYPNVQQMFLHSRIYAGYADPVESPLNPEPYAYEQGFAIKWLIKAQMDEVDFPGAYPHAPVLDYRTNIVPWLDWGTYMWASGTTVPCVNCPMYPVPTPPPAQPLKWVDTNPNHGDNNHCPINHVQTQECDFQAKTGTKIDNLHPSFCGRDKVSNLMMYFYCNSPYTTPWFTTSGQKCTWTPPDNSCTYGQGADTL